MPWLGQLFQKQESRSSFRVSSFCAGAAIRWRSEGSGDCRPLCHRGGVRRAALLRELRQVLPQLQLQFVLLINMEGPEAFSRPEAKLRNGDASDFSEIIQEIGTICLKKTLASVLVLKLLHYCNSKKHLEWWFLSCFFPFLPVTVTAFFFDSVIYPCLWYFICKRLIIQICSFQLNGVLCSHICVKSLLVAVYLGSIKKSTLEHSTIALISLKSRANMSLKARNGGNVSKLQWK